MNEEYVIQMKGIRKIYPNGVVANQDVDLNVRKGEIHALMGENGAGKSTLMKMLFGLEQPTEGEIYVNGEKVHLSSPNVAISKGIGMVHQHFMLVPSLTVAENIVLGMTPKKNGIFIDRQKAIKITEEYSKKFNLAVDPNARVVDIPVGMKQKVEILKALVRGAKILILDEPISNLDKNGINTVVRMLKDIKKQGTTVIISEHRIFEFAALADKIFHISDGVLENVWLPEEFIKMDCFKLSEYGFRHPDMVTNRCKRNKRLNRDLLLKNLCYHYRNTHFGIENINIEISKGDIVALIGGNGAGKTTLCKLLCGLISEKNGSIIWDGKVLKASQRRKISYFVMQDADYQLYADSVGNELVIGKKMTEELKEKAQTALDLFKLEKYINTHPASLSGGEKQRVTIASAYCSNTAIYIFDEPTSGMDGEGLLSFAEWVNLLANSGKIIIIITHDELLQTLVCDYKICLKNGKISKAIK